MTAEFSWSIEMIKLSPFYHNHTKKHNFQVIEYKNTTAIFWAHCVILANHYIRSSITKTFQLFLPRLVSCNTETGIRFAGTILKFPAKSFAPHCIKNCIGFCRIGLCIRLRANYERKLAQKGAPRSRI